MSFEFPPGEDLRASVTRCASEQLEHAVDELQNGKGHDRVESVHEARKALKKERSLLRLTRAAMPASQRRRENAALRAAARDLSGTRDADVMVQAVEQLSQRFAGQVPDRTFRTVRERLEAARAIQSMQLEQSDVPAATVVRELDAVRERVADWELARDGWSAIEDGLLRTYERGRAAFRGCTRDPSLPNLHAWRKRVKDLDYQQRLLEPTCGPAVGGQARDARHLHELLGEDHDLGVLRGTVAAMDVPADVDALVGLIDHRRQRLQREAMCIGARVYAEKPEPFRRRMRRYWKAGQAAQRVAAEQHPADQARLTRTPHRT